MNNKDTARLAPALQAVIPELRLSRHAMIMCPIEHVIRGLVFESSSYSKSAFYVWAFYMPSYVPKIVESLSQGRRLTVPGGGELMDLADARRLAALPEAVRLQALPLMNVVATPASMCAALEKALTVNSLDSNVVEKIAYTHAYMGNTERSLTMLERLCAMVDSKIPWQAEAATRARTLQADLRSGSEAVQSRLAGWKADTLRALKFDSLNK